VSYRLLNFSGELINIFGKKKALQIVPIVTKQWKTTVQVSLISLSNHIGSEVSHFAIIILNVAIVLSGCDMVIG